LANCFAEIGRNRTAWEGRRYAEKNDFHNDGIDVDGNPVPRDVSDYTKERVDVHRNL
jgi:hypothetical protein